MDWSALTGASSSVIALAALGFSVVTFRRQQARAERDARAKVKPLLWIQSQTYVDLKSIRLMNYGIGPAVIRKATFSKGDEFSDRVVDLFDLPIRRWEMFIPLKDGRAIPAQSEMTLVRQSLAHLVGEGYPKDEALKILRDWQDQKKGISVRIEYEDILGNSMPPIVDVLK
jgi:hypothetical protein